MISTLFKNFLLFFTNSITDAKGEHNDKKNNLLYYGMHVAVGIL